MKRTITFLIASLLLLGCTREEYSPSETFPSGGKFTFTVSPMKGETQTKSSFASGTGLLRTSIYMLAYQNGALVEGCSGYWADHNDLVTHFGDGQAYNLYFLMNTTRFIGEDWKAGGLDLRSEANLASLTYAIDSYSVFNTTGFPMAGVYKNWVSGVSPRNFELDRQISRIVLKLKDLEQSNVHLTVKSVTLHQATRKIRPFGASFAAASEDDIISEETLISDADAADHASAKDIVVLQDGGEILLYMLENMQGDLLAGNTDHWKKTPNSLLDSEDPAISSKAGLVTYVDINCSATTQASIVGDIHYSICLGDNTTTNFDIRRNYESSLDITYVTNNIIDHEWKQTSKGWAKNGVYEVTNRNIEARPVSICPGISDRVTIVCTGRDSFIEIDPSRTTFTGDTDNVSYSISKDGNKYNVSFSTTRVFDENTTVLGMKDAAPFTTATLTLYSKDAYNGDPNASITIPVKIYDCIFPIQFRYNDETGYLEARSNNPMGLGFKISYNGSVNGGSLNGTGYFVDVNGTYFVPNPSLGQSWQQVGDLGKGITGTSGMILNIDIAPYSSSMRMPYPFGETSLLPSYYTYPPLEPCFATGTTLYDGAGGVATYGPGTAVPSGEGGTGSYIYHEFNTESGYSLEGSDDVVNTSIVVDSKNERRCCGFSANIHPWSVSSGYKLYFFVVDHAICGTEYTQTNYYQNGCPFYVVNGDLIGHSYNNLRNDSTSGDVEKSRLSYYSLQPGRDLFDTPAGCSWLGCSTWTKKQLFNTHFWITGGTYSYGVHMTINGKTSWPLANRTEGGADSTPIPNP